MIGLSLSDPWVLPKLTYYVFHIALMFIDANERRRQCPSTHTKRTHLNGTSNASHAQSLSVLLRLHCMKTIRNASGLYLPKLHTSQNIYQDSLRYKTLNLKFKILTFWVLTWCIALVRPCVKIKLLYPFTLDNWTHVCVGYNCSGGGDESKRSSGGRHMGCLLRAATLGTDYAGHWCMAHLKGLINHDFSARTVAQCQHDRGSHLVGQEAECVFLPFLLWSESNSVRLYWMYKSRMHRNILHSSDIYSLATVNSAVFI